MHCLAPALSDVTFVSLRWCERHQSQLRYVIGLSTVLHLLGNVVASCLFLFISRHNYPGGHILWQLHSLESAHAGEGQASCVQVRDIWRIMVEPCGISGDVLVADVHVHLDTFVCQTGVSRFTQLNDNWM